MIALTGAKGAATAGELHVAAMWGDGAWVSRLLEQDVRVDEQNNLGMTALHLAAQNGFTSVAVQLVDHGANMNPRTNEGWTPLHYAAAYGQETMVAYLVSEGAEISARTHDGSSALKLASDNGFKHATTILLGSGADGPVRGGVGVTMPHPIKKVAPVLPTIALNTKLLGTVSLDAVVGKDGAVGQIMLRESMDSHWHIEAAVEALSLWKFKPGRLNGQPVATVVTVNFSFDR